MYTSIPIAEIKSTMFLKTTKRLATEWKDVRSLRWIIMQRENLLWAILKRRLKNCQRATTSCLCGILMDINTGSYRKSLLCRKELSRRGYITPVSFCRNNWRYIDGGSSGRPDG